MATGLAVEAEAQYELALTQEEVPVDTGALKASGRVEPASEGLMIASVIAYGGDEVDYALIVHEDLEAHHPNGKAKYVEGPVREEMSSGRAVARMSADIARMVASPLGAIQGRTRVSRAGSFSGRRSGFWLIGPGGKFIGSTSGTQEG
jgi:hypothetical protein